MAAIGETKKPGPTFQMAMEVRFQDGVADEDGKEGWMNRKAREPGWGEAS